MSTEKGVSAADAAEKEMKVLLRILAKAGVSEDVSKFITETLGVANVLDWGNATTDKDAADRAFMKTVVYDPLPEKPQAPEFLVISRLCASRSMAEAAFRQANEGGPAQTQKMEDLEADLPEDDRTTVEKEFKDMYHTVFSQETSPLQALKNRWYREFRSSDMSILPLTKMRSAAHAAALSKTNARKDLGNGFYHEDVDKVEVPDRVIDCLLTFLLGVRIMTHGWAQMGTNMKPSKKLRGKDGSPVMVCDCSLEAAEEHFDFLLIQAIQHQDSQHETLEWLRSREIDTRIRARALHQEGWPWGEALKEARDVLCQVKWAAANVTSSQQLASVKTVYDEAAASLEKAEPIQEPCPKWNDISGCTRRQRDCPHRKLHICNFRPWGRARCGSVNHGRHTCPQNPNSKKRPAPSTPQPPPPKPPAAKGGKGGKKGRGGTEKSKGWGKRLH